MFSNIFGVNLYTKIGKLFYNLYIKQLKKDSVQTLIFLYIKLV